MIVKGLLLIYLPKKGEDQQVFIQNLRSFLLAAVGLFVLLFRHPGLLGLTTLQCNIWFIISTTCYSLAPSLHHEDPSLYLVSRFSAAMVSLTVIG
ncbi:hypothetical protein Y032_0205g1909 [Ancylostoma ceylanicum]|uniref:Uncharacterized protein n=1 Tax=Ancylostoma ceylanicum TaxID=53326 RepID=A0A016SL62_9BILA|nr:hypothetical protein Y032_0205g1909 [Ancylostoma ceylanicum]